MSKGRILKMALDEIVGGAKKVDLGDLTKKVNVGDRVEAVKRMLGDVGENFTTGYRARQTGEGWHPVRQYLDLELERGNTPFPGYNRYIDGDYEVSWVSKTPKEAERYAVSAGELDALLAGRLRLPEDAVMPVDLREAIRVLTDEEGGHLFIRPRKGK